MILQPGNVLVIEKTPSQDETTKEALLTCYLRGWIEPIEKSIPKGKLNSDGSVQKTLLKKLGQYIESQTQDGL